jgi:hypothetical protein
LVSNELKTPPTSRSLTAVNMGSCLITSSDVDRICILLICFDSCINSSKIIGSTANCNEPLEWRENDIEFYRNKRSIRSINDLRKYTSLRISFKHCREYILNVNKWAVFLIWAFVVQFFKYS